MSALDSVEFSDKSGQVKCWGRTMAVFVEGDKVPDVDDHDTYSIAMREGGFVNVVESVLISWTDSADNFHVFDKYGDVFDNQSSGLLGESYEYDI